MDLDKDTESQHLTSDSKTVTPGQRQTAKQEHERQTIEYYNKHTLVYHDDERDQIIFYFKYKDDEGNVLNWRKLRELKDDKKWGVLKHPFVLHYVNEKLIDCGLFYFAHFVIYLSFLLLLSYHIFDRQAVLSFLLSCMAVYFCFLLILKGVIRCQMPQKTSKLYKVAFIFNLLCYIVTILYIWSPTIFAYDNYALEWKQMILWFLPIVAVIAAWVNLLYILRMSAFGIYIFMMVRILHSFGNIAIIWIPTLIAFSFVFHLIMKDSGTEPWGPVEEGTNSTILGNMFIILRAVTKVSTMMIGEVNADDILKTKQWIPSIIVLVFEIITVILLMNLMISLAVGDVSYLRSSAQDKLLKMNVNFVIEALQFSIQLPRFCPSTLFLHRKVTNNVLIIDKEGNYYSELMTDNEIKQLFEKKHALMADSTAEKIQNSVFQMSFSNPRMRMRIERFPVTGRPQKVHLKNCEIIMTETSDSGIPRLELSDIDNLPTVNNDTWARKFTMKFMGIEWKGHLDL